MVLITLSSFLSATVINLYMRTDKKNKVPVWLRKASSVSALALVLGLLCLCQIPVLAEAVRAANMCAP